MINIPYINKGIFPSEMNAFIDMAEKYACSAVIESGILHGYSTRYLCEWAKSLRKRTYIIPQIYSCEKQILPEVEKYLKETYSKELTLYTNEDSFNVFPKILSGQSFANPFFNTAVLIDGPKQELALQLKDMCFEYSQVQFVAIHDLRKELAVHGDYNTISGYGPHEEFLDEQVGDYKTKYPKGTGLTFFINKKKRQNLNKDSNGWTEQE